MRKPLRSLLILLSIVIVGVTYARAQDSLRVVILSPKVGPVITPEKCAQFHIFAAYEGLQRAVVYRGPSGAFYVGIDLLSKSGEHSIVLVPYSQASLRMMAEKIDHFDELQSGTYRIGMSHVELMYADTAAGARIALDAKENRTWEAGWSDRLHFADPLLPPSDREYPFLRFGAGISTNSCDLGGIQSLFNDLAAQYRSRGYSVSTDNVNSVQPEMLWFSLHLMIVPTVGAVLEAGRSGGDAGTFRTASVSLIYRVPLGEDAIVRPYIGLGLAHYDISINQNFPHSINDRVSPVDTSGAFAYLAGVSVTGGAHIYGEMITAGIDVNEPFQGAPDFDLFVRDLIVPSMHVTSGWGSTRDLSLGGVVFGVRMLIRF